MKVKWHILRLSGSITKTKSKECAPLFLGNKIKVDGILVKIRGKVDTPANSKHDQVVIAEEIVAGAVHGDNDVD